VRKTQVFCDECGKEIIGAQYPSYVEVCEVDDAQEGDGKGSFLSCCLNDGDGDLCGKCTVAFLKNMLPKIYGAFEKEYQRRQQAEARLKAKQKKGKKC